MANDTRKNGALVDGEPNSGSVVETDSRVFASTRSGNDRARDVGALGEQFILASWATLVAGLWLIIAPWVLTFADSVPKARANDLVLGIVIASMGATRVFGNYRSGRLNQLLSGLTALPAIWLIIAPFVLNYSSHARPRNSDIIAGIAVLAFSGWAYMVSRNDDDNDSHRQRRKRR